MSTKKILLHSNQLGLRGSEIALYDYAYYLREILNLDPIICSDKHSNQDSLMKFKNKFNVILYENFLDLQQIVDRENVEYSYFIKAGNDDGKTLKNTKNLIHSVFQYKEVHGDVYAYVSKWLSYKMSDGILPYVPHMVDIAKYQNNLNYRESLNIDPKSMVYGYYGGSDSFNIKFVKDLIIEYANKNKNVYFIFMNVNKFSDLKNILFFKGSYDINTKVSFINTCNACLHARDNGESFGLTIAEFSSLNKPIITHGGYSYSDLAHIEQLKSNAFIYNNSYDLVSILDNFNTIDSNRSWNSYSEYEPLNVIKQFNDVFIK